MHTYVDVNSTNSNTLPLLKFPNEEGLFVVSFFPDEDPAQSTQVFQRERDGSLAYNLETATHHTLFYYYTNQSLQTRKAEHCDLSRRNIRAVGASSEWERTVENKEPLRDFLASHSVYTRLETLTLIIQKEADQRSVTELQELLFSLPNLKKLNLKGYSKLENLDLTGCIHLENLSLANCPNLQKVNFSGYSNLKTLRLSDCPQLETQLHC